MLIVNINLYFKAIEKETKSKIEAFQSENRELRAEDKFNKELNINSSNIVPTKLEEIGNLEARINALTMDIEPSPVKIEELETGKDASDKALHENIQSLSVNVKVLQGVQSQYNTEKRS